MLSAGRALTRRCLRPRTAAAPASAGLHDYQVSSQLSLAGQKAVVTGGTAGVGESITRQFLAAGASVAVVARDKTKFDHIQATVPMEEKDQLEFIAGDLFDAENTKEAAKQAMEWAGGSVDILVNSAGIALLDRLEDLTAEKFDATFAVNVRAPLLMAQGVVSGMIEQRRGKIINISSQAGTAALELHGAYCASKSALDSLTRVQCVEWSRYVALPAALLLVLLFWPPAHSLTPLPGTTSSATL